MMSVKPVLIMAGGTGGHVFPALAVADELRARGVPVVWLGTHKGIEARVVKKAGYQIEWLSITGLRGKSAATLLLAPVRLVIACSQAFKVLWQRKPCAVLGMGGFVSGPGGLVAAMMRIPLVLHEQNSAAGLTNKWLARLTRHVFTGFPAAAGISNFSGLYVSRIRCAYHPTVGGACRSRPRDRPGPPGGESQFRDRSNRVPAGRAGARGRRWRPA